MDCCDLGSFLDALVCGTNLHISVVFAGKPGSGNAPSLSPCCTQKTDMHCNAKESGRGQFLYPLPYDGTKLYYTARKAYVWLLRKGCL